MTPVWPMGGGGGGGGGGGKTDQLFRLSTYAFPTPLNTFLIHSEGIKATIKEI